MVEMVYEIGREMGGRFFEGASHFAVGDFLGHLSHAIAPGTSARVTVLVDPICDCGKVESGRHHMACPAAGGKAKSVPGVIMLDGDVVMVSGKGEWLAPRLSDVPDGRYRVRSEWVRIPDPKPERVKWPWPDVSRVKIGPLEGYPSKARQVLIWGGSHWIPWFVDREHVLDSFGTWPANESRIAENDNGFVKLSEVPDAK